MKLTIKEFEEKHKKHYKHSGYKTIKVIDNNTAIIEYRAQRKKVTF